MKKTKQILWLGVVILIGFGLGFLCGRKYAMRKENPLQYGVTEQNLRLQSVSWKEYPAYRELTFTIDGDISFRTKPDGCVAFQDLVEPDRMEETGRVRNLMQSCDVVTYRLNCGKAVVNIPKRYQDNIISFISDNSYYLTFHEKEAIYTAGCISVSDANYVPWTAVEIRNSVINMEAYLSAFSLSGTYDSTKPLHQKLPKEGIVLSKETGNYLNCRLYNNTEKVWDYEQSLPHIELWYKGIWIELNAPFDNNLSIGTLAPFETKHYEIPKETMDQYPFLFPGVYRFVIYGENDEFAASEPFFYEDRNR